MKVLSALSRQWKGFTGEGEKTERPLLWKLHDEINTRYTYINSCKERWKITPFSENATSETQMTTNWVTVVTFLSDCLFEDDFSKEWVT